MDQGCRLCVLSPEICIVVVIRISLRLIEVKADAVHCLGKQQSCLRYGEYLGHHRGLRPGLRLVETTSRRGMYSWG